MSADHFLPAELASFYPYALSAAAQLPSNAAAAQLVTITLAALRPPC